MRVEAHEVVAFGIKCDGIGCEVLVPTRNAQSRPTGYFLTIERVTAYGNRSRTPEEVWFHSKECLLHTLEFGLSALTSERLEPKGLGVDYEK